MELLPDGGTVDGLDMEDQQVNIRIRVIGGPWPERIGCEGHVVPDPGDRIYPFDKPLSDAWRVVHLDGDDGLDRTWTCVIRKRDIEFLPGSGHGE